MDLIRKAAPELLTIDQVLPAMGWRVVLYDKEVNGHVVEEVYALALVHNPRRRGDVQRLAGMLYDPCKDEMYPAEERKDYCCLLQPTEAPPDVNACRGEAHPPQRRRVMTGDAQYLKARV